MRDQYIILRFLAFHLWREKIINFSYKSNPDDFLAEVMKTINDFTPDQIHQLEQWFKKSMAQSFAILGADGFRFEAYNVNRRPINMALFEVLAHFFTLVDIKVMDRSALKKNLAELKMT